MRILGDTAYGQGFSYVEWLVGFSGGAQETYYQARGRWFEVLVPSGASSIEIEGNAVGSGEMPAGPTVMSEVSVVS